MHAFDVLGDPVRRRILELLIEGERTSGDVTETVRAEFGISQPAVSQHLKVLRDAGFVDVRVDGARRSTCCAPSRCTASTRGLRRFCAFWEQRLDALGTEIKRGQSARRRRTPSKRSATR